MRGSVLDTGVKLTPAEEEDLRKRWQRAVGPRYEVTVRLPIKAIRTENNSSVTPPYITHPCRVSFTSPAATLICGSLLFQVCHLERFGETSGLGISLEARAGHHYLCSILPEGPVGQCGKIFIGDEILEVISCMFVWNS